MKAEAGIDFCNFHELLKRTYFLDYRQYSKKQQNGLVVFRPELPAEA